MTVNITKWQPDILFFLMEAHNTTYELFFLENQHEVDQGAIANHQFTGNAGERETC